MNCLRRLAACCLLLILGSPAWAAREPIYEVLPYPSNIWWNPARAGHGWFFGTLPAPAVGQPALTSAAYYTYGNDGRADWLLMTGVYEATTPYEAFTTGVLGHLTAPLYAGTAGSCPTCPYIAPKVDLSAYGSASLTYTSAIQAQVEFDDAPSLDGGKIHPFEFDAIRTLADTLVGSWLGPTRVLRSDGREVECDAIITTMASPAAEDRYLADDSETLHVPPTGAQWFKVEQTQCSGAPLREVYYAWLDPASLRVFALAPANMIPVLEGSGSSARTVAYRIPSQRYVIELHLQGPNQLISRTWAANALKYTTAPIRDSFVSLERRQTRQP